MKRFLFTFMAIMFFVMQGWTQTTLNESFEGSTFPPEDWTIATTSGSESWVSSTTIAHTGTKSAKSAFRNGGVTRWLITPKLSVTSDATNFGFWIATNTWYSDGDEIDIFISTTDNQTTSFSTTSLLSLTEDSVTTTWTQHSVDLSAYVGQNIYVAIRVVDHYGFNTFIDDVTGPEIYAPACAKPRDITFSNITTTSVDISWINGHSTDNAWRLFYRETGTTNWDSVSVTSNPFTLNQINPSTSYDVYMKTDCSTELSDPSIIYIFRTQCDVISSLPWSDNFDTYGTETFPPCWTRPIVYNDSGTNYPRINIASSSTYFHSSPATLMLISSPSVPTYAVTPAFSANINTLMVTFWLKASDVLYSGTITVGVMDSDTSTATFEAVQTITPTTTAWTQYVVMLSGVQLQGGNKHIAFRHNLNDGGWSGYAFRLDDVTVGMIPDCPNVYGLTAEVASTTSLSVNWTDEGDNGEGYNIAYSPNPTGAFDPTTATIIPISTGTTLPYIISGFNLGDSVWVAVQRGCLGPWTNAVKVNFPTSVNNLPFIANFEDPAQDNIWTITNGAQTNKWYIGAAGANDLDISDTDTGRGLYISNDTINAVYDNTSSSVVFASTLVEFDNSPSFQLSFDWSCVGYSYTSFGTLYPSDYVNIYLLPLEVTLNPGTLPSAQYNQYKLNAQGLCNENSFQTFSQPLNSSYSNTVKRLVFAWKNTNWGSNDSSAKIDNISLVALSCGMPSNLTLDSAAQNGTDVYLSWAEPQGATSWIVEYQQIGTGIWNQTLATSNPFTLTGLNSGTAYQARVRSICNSTDTSAISNLLNFQTSCLAVASPFFEGFSLGVVPPSTCWQRGAGALSTSGASIVSPASYGWSYNSDPMQSGWGGHAVLSLDVSENYWLISPSIDAGDGTSPLQLELDLSYSSYDALSSVASGDNDNTFAVIVSTDNGLTWNSSNIIRKYDSTSNSPVTLDFIGVSPNRIIVPLFDSLNQPYTGEIKIGLFGSTLTYGVYAYLHIDNIELLPFTACQRPTDLLASAVTSSTANISFIENGSATAWQYVISDGTITDPNNGTIISTSTNPIQLTNLLPQTQYTIWVRSNCSTETSVWSSPLTFLTEAAPALVPYSCDFENSVEAQAWRKLSGTVNNWAIGQAAGNGPSTQNTADSTAAYISNDNGVSYTMSNGDIYAYGYRDIDFGTVPASYTLNFDWKCQGYIYGTSTYSGLRVYLKDPSEAININGYPNNVNADLLGLFANDSTWQTEQISIDNVSGVKRLIFFYFDSYNNVPPPAAIDNISINIETCPRPFNVTASNPTTTSVEISWSNSGADSYIVSYRSNTIGSTLTHDAATSSPYTVQNLTLGTQYIVTVRAICGGDTTVYSQSTLFSTLCTDDAISSFPWTESFENGLNCWQQTYVNGTLIWTNPIRYNSYTAANEGTKIALFYGTDRSNITKLISPMLNIASLSDPYISYYYVIRNWGITDRDTLRVYSRPSEDSSWTLLRTFYALDTYAWEKDSIALPYPSTTYQIAFEGIERCGHGVGLDNIKVYDANSNSCVTPTNITIPTATITNTTAIVNWVAGNQETAWQIRLDATGTPIDVNTTTYPLTGLLAGTNYTVYVRANCGTGVSSWASQTFTTTPIYQSPTVTTVQETGTTQTSTTLNGSYIEGTNPVLVKGFQWKEPSASAWTIAAVSAGTTPFAYLLNGLSANTQYEFRAYVETSLDTTYGTTLQFTTLANTPPTVTTDSIDNITQTSATFYGTITQGTEQIEARGFEYKLSSETWEDAINISATGVSNITANPTTLIQENQYDTRAYARTSSDIFYGNVKSFSSLSLNGVDGKEISIMMYPNPATNETKLIVSGVSGATKIVLSDVQGRILNTIDTKAVNGEVEQTIDVNNLTKGVYYVRIQNSNLSRTNKLIVK